MHGETYVDANVKFITRTDMAVLVSWDEDQSWIPRSCVSYRCDQAIEKLKRGDEFELTVAEWKAIELGLDIKK